MEQVECTALHLLHSESDTMGAFTAVTACLSCWTWQAMKKNQQNSSQGYYLATIWLLLCITIFVLLTNFLKKMEKRRRRRTFHLALTKFFSICAHTFSLMFLSEAAPPEILLYKMGTTQLHNTIIPPPLCYDNHGKYLHIHPSFVCDLVNTDNCYKFFSFIYQIFAHDPKY